MNEYLEERFVLSFEKIASALEGIHGELRKAGNRYWPEPRPQREAVLSRIPNEEDKAKESLGIDGKPIKEWLADLDIPEEDDGIIGERTAQWLRDHPKEKQASDAGPEAPSRGKQKGKGSKKAKN